MCPALALYCTVHFHLSTIGQSSFQEFTKCHTSRTLPTKPRFDVPSYLERNKLHENRRAYFDGLVLRLANPPASGMVWGSHNMTELHVLHAQIFLPYRLWSWDAQSDTSQIGTPLCEHTSSASSAQGIPVVSRSLDGQNTSYRIYLNGGGRQMLKSPDIQAWSF
jgi:hypothetical protein